MAPSSRAGFARLGLLQSRLAVGRTGLAPLPRRQRFQTVGANGRADQAQRGQAHGCGHAPHLPVAPLLDAQFNPCAWLGLAHPDRRRARPQPWRLIDQTGPSRAGDAVVQRDAQAKRVQRMHIGLAFDLHPVDFFHFVAGVRNPRLQGAVVGQQQQAFAVGVQPAGYINAGHLDDVFQTAPATLGRELTQHALGLVQADQAGV